MPQIPLSGCALKANAASTSQIVRPLWFKRRSYPHFDRQIDFIQAVKLATDPEAVAKRSFMPFLAFNINQKRYKKQDDGTRKKDIKCRQVAFASHCDAAIFSYYAYLLKPLYENALEDRMLGNHVLAYRRFVPPKCNIHFAIEAFAEIERRSECVAVALDIEKFFDTIPHDALKQKWTTILGKDSLPADHYAVYKAITRWAKVNCEDAYVALDISRRQGENWKHPNTLCSPLEFREKIRGNGLIQRGYEIQNEKPVGIPQGSPISAFLSNLVMLDADTKMAREALKHDVYYRRYADDILLVGSCYGVAALEIVLKKQMQALGFKINDDKTARSVFRPDRAGLLEATEPLQYLGFTFDGKRILVRPQTLAKFYRRMMQGVRSAKRAAISASKQGGSRKLRRQNLYGRYSHLKQRESKTTQSRGPKAQSNFYSYVKKSNDVMNRTEIMRQLRRHWTRLNAEIKYADEND